MLSKEDLIEAKSVRRVKFNDEDYFCLEDVAALLQGIFNEVETIILPFGRVNLKFSTYEQIEAGRKDDPFSEFNQFLLKARRFKD